jgi:hypothetical protein
MLASSWLFLTEIILSLTNSVLSLPTLRKPLRQLLFELQRSIRPLT